MSLLKLMSIFTMFSIAVAVLSFIWQMYVALTAVSSMTTLLMALLKIEATFKPAEVLPPPRVAIGYGACTDLLLSGPSFLTYKTDIPTINLASENDFNMKEIKNEQQLLQAFGYYFKNGAAAERIVSNMELFESLISAAKKLDSKNATWEIGGNAPLMSMRFIAEGAEVMLGAPMSARLRRYLPRELKVIGDYVNNDDIHMILEYKSGDRWGPFIAPRANRYILHNDQQNPQLDVVDEFSLALRSFAPQLLVICGLQVMDGHAYDVGEREVRLLRVHNQLTLQPFKTLTHFEMASYAEVEMLMQLNQFVIPYMDSLGMNEQELENLRQLLLYGRLTYATEWNPRVAKTLDHIRNVFNILTEDYLRNELNARALRKRLLTRIHVHTLAYQVIMTVKGSRWKNSKIAAAKAALTAHRYVCQTQKVHIEAVSLILDDSFSTTTRSKTSINRRIKLNLHEGVACWDESIEFGKNSNKNNSTAIRKIDIEFCVAPVLLCRVAKKTAGAGDNISAAALAMQI